MANPARELLPLLQAWNVGGPPGPARGIEDPSVAQLHIDAMRLVAECQAAMDDLARRGLVVDIYREASISWARTVMAVASWSQTGITNDHIYPSGRLDMLEAFAVLLDGMPVQVNIGQADNLDSYFDRIVELLAEDTDIDAALRRYVFDLVTEARDALNRYRVTSVFDAEDALTKLWVALGAAEGQSKKAKTRWRKLATELRTPVAAGIIANLPTLAIEALQGFQ